MQEIKILYEDEYVLVLDKPTGLIVHSDGKTEESNLADWVLENYPNVKDVGEPMFLTDGRTIDRPGIVHRLDRDTSGAMIIAKTKESFTYLKRQFKERKVKKNYRAFVYGSLKKDLDTIERPIGKSRKDFRLWSAQRGARGGLRDAVTKYSVIDRNKEATYVDIFPKTGRTHQIRVHLKAIHHPVVCDSLYAPKKTCLLGFSRLALHALKLSFESVDGLNIEVEAELPEDFERAVSLIKQ